MKPQRSAPSVPSRWSLLAALTLLAPLASAQVAPTPNSDSAALTDEVQVLSPFQVNAGTDRGYQATSTLSGTRLNTSLEDLAASISVVTKQQLTDTAATDINDVFKYELNTEGIYQWTDITVDRGNVSDNVANNPAGANRVRGLTNANIASNGFATSLPVDTYNIDAVEISRGPNSNIFGLGNAGGSVNLIPSKANIQRAVTRFTTRGDSFGGYRGTFDVNRPLIKGKLGARVLGVYEDKGFKLDPAKDVTRRLQLGITARPTSSTTINASFESYRNYNSRPNSITPRDMRTDWINSGKPTWDPINQIVHLADGSSVTYAQASANRAQYYGIDLVNSAFANVPSWYIDNGQVQLYAINRMPNSSGTGPNNVSGTQYLLQNGNNYTVNSSVYPLFTPVSVSDKSIYDWSRINLASPNFQTIRGETSNVSIEQFFLRTPRQTLALQASWLYERTATYDRRFLGVGNSTQLFIDINEKLLDGTPNPYFLRPYVGASAPGFRRGRNNNEHYRGVLAYDLDLTHEHNWLRWLGRNRFTGLAEYQQIYGGSLGYQDTISSTNSWMGGAPASRNSSSYRAYARYYVGDANGQNVDYAPKGIASPPYTYTLNYYNGVTKQWLQEPVTFDEYYDANRLNRRLLNTYQGNWQGWFLDGRIVPTVGVTRDINRSRDGNSAINPTAATNGYYDMTPMWGFGQYDWIQRHGTTKTAGVVVKPLSWLHLTYSQSDAFSPGSTAYDVFGNALPDPTGETKDYGFALTLFRNKLEIRAKQYETTAMGRGTSDLNTIVQRIIRMDYRSSSGDPGLGTFLRNQLQTVHPDWTEDQFNAEIQRLSGIDMTYLRGHINKTHGDNSDAVSRGQEIEAVYNPTPYWTMRATASRANPLNGSLSPAAEQYIADRWQMWTTIKDPITGKTWWDNPGDNNTVPRDWYTNNVDANLKLATALKGKRRAQTREYRVNFVTNYRLAGLTDNRWLKPMDVGGSVRYESKAAIGYYGAAPTTVNGVTAIREYDPSRPIWDKEHYYFDLMTRYRFKLFHDRVGCTLQLNVNNVFENGRLQAVAVNPDGQPWAFRIIDPRQFILSATFDL